jgi:hypothetical protein
MQFSLATPLIGTAILAVVVAICVAVPVHENGLTGLYYGTKHISELQGEIYRPPTGAEVAMRLAWSGPLALAAIWCIRATMRPCVSCHAKCFWP